MGKKEPAKFTSLQEAELTKNKQQSERKKSGVK
jgi:hypothetical protein